MASFSWIYVWLIVIGLFSQSSYILPLFTIYWYFRQSSFMLANLKYCINCTISTEGLADARTFTLLTTCRHGVARGPLAPLSLFYRKALVVALLLRRGAICFACLSHCPLFESLLLMWISLLSMIKMVLLQLLLLLLLFTPLLLLPLSVYSHCHCQQVLHWQEALRCSSSWGP
jgi:hypothetical protein